jgi:hypothetical protein
MSQDAGSVARQMCRCDQTIFGGDDDGKWSAIDQAYQCRRSINIVQMAVAVLLLADPVAVRTAQSCAESAVTVTSNMSDNVCRLHTKIGSVNLNDLWKAVGLGVYHDANAQRDALRAAPVLIHIDNWADQILNRIAFRQTDTRLNLVQTTVSDLGFGSNRASLKDIYERALQLGLVLCPAEVGSALRLAYLDQPLGEYLHIAMEPIARFDGGATDFSVAKGLGGWLLNGEDVRDDRVLAGDTRLVFVQPDGVHGAEFEEAVGARGVPIEVPQKLRR